MLTNALAAETPHAAILNGTPVEDGGTPTPGQLVAGVDAAVAGLFTFWTCTGDLNHEEFSELWKDAGGDVAHLPAPTTPACAIRYAAQRIAATHGLLLRPLRIGRRRVGLGWVLVRETGVEPPPPVEGAAVETDTEALASQVEGAAVDLNELPAENATQTPEGDPLAFTVVAIVRTSESETPTITRATAEIEAELLDAYGYFRTHLTPRDMAGWLPARVAALNGVGIRPHGGAYFIPADARAEWDRIVRTLKAVSQHKVYGIPVLPAEATAVAVLDAIEREATLFAEAAVMDMPTLGERGRKNRLDDTAKLIEKLKRYETLFGAGRLEKVRETLGNLEGAKMIADLVPAAASDAS